MRLREIQNIISIALPKLDIAVENIASQFRLKNVLQNIEGLNLLSKIKELDQYTIPVLEVINVTQSRIDTILIDHEIYNKYASSMNALKTNANFLWTLLNNLLSKEDENQFSIKLPIFKNFKDLGEFFNDFEIIQEPFKRLGSHVEIESFETGSFWVTIKYIGGTIASATLIFSNIMRIAFSMHILKKRNEATNLILKGYSTGLNMLENLQKEQEQLIDNLRKKDTEKYIKSLDLEETASNEILSFSIKSIKLIEDYIDKGMEVYQSLSSSEEVNNLFPNFKEKNNLIEDTKIKILTENIENPEIESKDNEEERAKGSAQSKLDIST